jgi:hypothetical protein
MMISIILLKQPTTNAEDLSIYSHKTPTVIDLLIDNQAHASGREPFIIETPIKKMHRSLS